MIVRLLTAAAVAVHVADQVIGAVFVFDARGAQLTTRVVTAARRLEQGNEEQADDTRARSHAGASP